MISKVPFVNYINEDKSSYPTATDSGYYDPDNDFLVGNSTGFLFNINFIFVNTYLLRTSAIHYEKYGNYIDSPVDSSPHRKFRVQEESRRLTGYTAKCKLLTIDIPRYKAYISNNQIDKANDLVKQLRITGEHYNFINYGIISKLNEHSITISKNGKVTGVKSDGIPIFFGAQYWWYKSKEFAKNNGYHVICGKSRRGGFSYMEAIGSANTVNLNPSCTVIHVADELKHLIKGRVITRMSLMQLEHYEINTPFKRGILSRQIEDIQLGYKTKKGSNSGYESHILSLAASNSTPEIAVGKDAIEIKCEELSLFEAFDEFMTVTEPTTRTGAVVTGSIIGWGTGGSETGNWEIFEKNFYNPAAFNFIPFENVWDIDSRDKICGYYKPYIDSLQGFSKDGRSSLDKDGNTDYELAIEISDEEREIAKKKAKTIQDYITYCGQYANMPSESFSSTTDNLFTSETLNLHINKIRHNPDYKFYTDGMVVQTNKGYEFKSNFKLHDEGIKVHSYIEDVPPRPGSDYHGCIRMWHHPFINPKTGKVPPIYSISYDPVGSDKKNPNNKNSYNSITVWMNPNEYFSNITKLRVANFFGRPETLEEADEIARLICMIYGGYDRIMLAEINRGETKSNFKKWGCTRLLAREPVVVWDVKIKETEATSIGINLDNDIRKIQGLKLLKAMIYKKVGSDDDGEDIVFIQTIPDLSFLLELQKWRLDGNFDRVSDAIVEAFADKKAEIQAHIKLKNISKTKEVGIFEREWA